MQGVGFRPFVYRLARELSLGGTVSNTPAGVTIEVEGPSAVVEVFFHRLETEKPPLSVIASVDRNALPANGVAEFHIVHSTVEGTVAAHVLPDIATCPDCLREVRDPSDRRYRYPFTNCTNCGPRFSIIQRLPYDRPNTSMAGFAMCAACRAEYDDPADRRFHAQPTACPECGPQLALWDREGAEQATRHEALVAAADAIRAGKAVGVKGLGGFHLVVDACNETAVHMLHERKQRKEKPFALMYPGIDMVRRDCVVSDTDARLLAMPEAPIVLLPRTGEGPVAPSVAPGSPDLGVMLPYTPLHHLLLDELGSPVVATSGNLSEEPICIDEHEAVRTLGGLADCLLVHDRPIVRHVDDSIVRVVAGREMVLRRARGFAPLPIRVAKPGPVTLAVGAHLKNTVALGKGRDVFISQHIGDLEAVSAHAAHERVAADLKLLFDASPSRVAADLHPDYLSTKHARSLGLPVIGVQHHHAHVVACMAEHGLTDPVLGVSWDGSGYGPDGTIWGGEFLRADARGFDRVAHLHPFRLPGGEAAVKEPRRSALGLLWELPEVARDNALPCMAAFTDVERANLVRLMERGLNAPVSTSAGRLFDGVAALLGLRQVSRFEGQAAMALEYAARDAEAALLDAAMTLDGTTLDWRPLVAALAEAMTGGAGTGALAHAFHEALVEGIVMVAGRTGLADVVLTGGCFQNALLTEHAAARLRAEGFTPHWHRLVPPNDGGVALGQAVVAMEKG